MAVLKFKDLMGVWHSIPAIQGASAYEQAQTAGYTGTLEDFYADLVALETAVTDAEQAEVDAQSAQTAAEAARDLAQGYAAQLAAGVASPAGTYADLDALNADIANVDTDRIYVTEYDGKWCYHNGSAFVAGGVYQAASVVGDIASINSQLADYVERINSELGEEHIIRTLSNGTKDEMLDGKKIGRVGSKVLQASDVASMYSATNVAYAIVPKKALPGAHDLTMYGNEVDVIGMQIETSSADNVANIGKYYLTPTLGLLFILAKGTTLEQARAIITTKTVNYQLAQPVTISFPSPMTPNTTELMRLFGQFDSLTETVDQTNQDLETVEIELNKVGLIYGDVTFEQGTLKLADGDEFDSAIHIRSGYKLLKDCYGFTIKNEYVVRIFYYDSNFSFVKYTEHRTSKNIIYDKATPFIRLVIHHVVGGSYDLVDITPLDDTGFLLLTTRNAVERLLGTVRNFIQINAHAMPAVISVLEPIALNPVHFRAIVISDLHGNLTSLDDAYALQQAICPTAVMLNPGDMFNLRPQNDGIPDPLIPIYMEKAENYCVYHTIGQHEVGFGNPNTDSPPNAGRAKNNCFSHSEVFTNFIEPLLSTWELEGLTTNYYYKDFSSSNVRLISLYQYNIPLIDDPDDSNYYKYIRSTVWYGQDQIDWLISTLGSTPEGYHVILMLHQPDAAVTVSRGTPFADNGGLGGNVIISGTPIQDIIEAYINKDTVNQTYHCKDPITYPTEDFEIVAQADFSSAKGSFLNYYSGDMHFDYIGVFNGTNQRVIGLTSSGRPGNTKLRPGSYVESSIVNALGYNFTDGYFNIARLGQTYSYSGVESRIARFSISS